MQLSTLQLQLLPYVPDSAAVFAAVAQRPWSVFLDSGFPHSTQGRFDIISSDPNTTLVTQGAYTTINQQGRLSYSEADPFTLLKQQLLSAPSVPKHSDLPFNTGAIGYFSYDLARRLEALPQLALDAEQLPEMMVGIYQWAVIVDHVKQQTWLIGQQLTDTQWQALIKQFTPPYPDVLSGQFQITGMINSNMDAARYQEAFNKIKQYLQAGDCYQVNLTQRFSASCVGDAWEAYARLRMLNAAPFSAYLNLPQVQILSSSPERFLKVTAGHVETKPIKGTRPRKPMFSEDQAQIEALSHSVKDRAENVMIVDLLRNDIGKTCQPGSVQVPKLFAIESYRTVHHLVSTITGRLQSERHALDLLRDCFPGGSITGAPKIRAMQIIEELEPHRRGIYCGAIGYIGFNGNMDTNIAIRTLVHSQQQIRCWAGGGIVYDSDMQSEYQESFDKAQALLTLLREFSV